MASAPAASDLELPSTHKALVLTSRDEPLTVQTVTTPAPSPGSAIVKVLAATILSYAGDVYSGKRPYPFVTPLVPGTSAVARVAALGTDSTSLKVGQLVLVDSIFRSRDEPTHAILHGLVYNGPEAHKLMDGEWRDGTYAQYTKVPLEAVYPIDEARLLGPLAAGGLALTPAQMAASFQCLVPFGGLDDIALRPGETIIIAPATGPFGSAAVRVALALGAARVIAFGRNTDALAALKAYSPSSSASRIATVTLTTDAAADAAALLTAAAGKPIDAFFDISPPQAADSHHLSTCISTLRHGGRVSLMGGIVGDVALPHRAIMRRGLTVRGTWMYTRSQALRLIGLVESGLLDLGAFEVAGEFALGQWQEGFRCAAETAGPGKGVVIAPWK